MKNLITVNSNEVTLNVKLPPYDIDTVNKILLETKNIPPLSARNMLEQIQKLNTSAPIFNPLRDFLVSVEGNCPVTYNDQKGCLSFSNILNSNSGGDMTIGIGLDIASPAHNNTEALFHELDPSRDWEFQKMQTTIGLPQPPLTDDPSNPHNQVDQLLCLTLIGATYPAKTMTYEGQTEKFVNSMEKYGLADTLFKPYELIALQSLSYNVNSLIGENLCNALKYYKSTGDFRPVLIQIVDCSNKLKNDNGTPKSGTNGVENRRLIEAGLFCNNPAGIQLSYRKFDDIKKNLAQLGQTVVSNADPVWGSPYENAQANFTGKNGGYSLSGCKNTDPTKYATDGNDIVELGPGAIGYAGEGQDILRSKQSASKALVSDDEDGNAIYLAGNEDLDSYEITTSHGTAFIFDNGGYLTLDNDRLQGAAIFSKENAYILSVNNYQYTLSYFPNIGNVVINSGSTINPVTIANFRGGQFNIGLMNGLSPFYSTSDKFYQCGINSLRSNQIVMAVNAKPVRQAYNQVIAYIYDYMGQLAGQFPIFRTSNDIENTNGIVVVPTTGDNFVVSWILNGEYDDGINSGSLTTVQAAICNTAGVLQIFTIPVSEIIQFCVDDGPYECTVQSLRAISFPDGSYKIFFAVLADINAIKCFDSVTGKLTQLFTYNTSRLDLCDVVTMYNGYMLTFGPCESDDDDEEQNYSLMRFDFSNRFIETFTVLGSQSSPTVTGLSNGFLVSYYNVPTSSLITKIYRDGVGFSAGLDLGKVYYTGTLATTLPNDNVLVLSHTPYANQMGIATTGIIIDSNNKPVGNSFFLPEYNLFSFPLSNADNMIFSFTRVGNGGMEISGRYFSVSAFQPPQLMQREITQDNEKIVNAAATFKEQNQQELASTSDANQHHPAWYTPVGLFNNIKNVIKNTWNVVSHYNSNANVSEISSYQLTGSRTQQTHNKYSSSASILCELSQEDNLVSLNCDQSGYKLRVYPKVTGEATALASPIGNSSPFLNGDHYDINTCRVVEYEGQPTAYCEGEATTVLLTPDLPEKPFENLSGNIALGAVVINGVRNLFTAKEAKIYLPDNEYRKEMIRFRSKITALRAEFPNLQKLYADIFTSLEASLADMKYAGKATRQETGAFRGDVKHARKFLREQHDVNVVMPNQIDVAVQKNQHKPVVSTLTNYQPMLFNPARPAITAGMVVSAVNSSIGEYKL